MVHLILQGSVQVGMRLGGTAELHVLNISRMSISDRVRQRRKVHHGTNRPHLAQVVSSFFAHSASTTSMSTLDSDSITDLEARLTFHITRGRRGRFGTERGDNTTSFVSENEGVDDLEISVGSVHIVVD